VANIPTANAGFGERVAVDGDTILVGSPYVQLDGYPYAGAVYVFRRLGNAWSLQQTLVSGDPLVSQFGYSLSLSGETAVISAHAVNALGNSDFERPYVFVRSGTVWSEQQRLRPSDATVYDGTTNVSIAGDRIIVGAVLHEHLGHRWGGGAYVFTRNAGVWSEEQELRRR